MKIVVVTVLLVLLAIGPVLSFPTLTYREDIQDFFNGSYDDWQSLMWASYPTFDMGSFVPISSVGVHENTLGGLVHSLYIQFSDDGITWPGDILYRNYDIVKVMDNSSIVSGEKYWAIAQFEPITTRYCRFFADSTGTYIRSDEFMINGHDGAGNPVPEHSSLIALSSGIATLGLLKRRKRG